MNGLEQAAQWHEQEAERCEKNISFFELYNLHDHARTYRDCRHWHLRAAKELRALKEEANA